MNGDNDSPYLTMTQTGTETAVSVILKLRGETCDIDCLYCYEKRKESPGGARIGVQDIARLPQLFGGRPLVVELHGGEPLTAGQPYLREVLAALAEQPLVQRATLQTNGIRLDDSWLDLFDEVYPDLRIGISLDGDRRGNIWRVGYDGEEIYPGIVAALERCGARGRKVGIITAVTPAVLGRATAVLDHLTSFPAVDAISFVPCFDSTITKQTAITGDRVSPSRISQRANITDAGPAWAITPDEYADFVLAAAVRWVHGGAHRKVKLEPVVSAIRRLRGADTGFCHFSNLKCDHVFTLYPDGRFGSCDELPWPDAQLGQLPEFSTAQEIAATQRQLPLLVKGRSLTSKCSICRYRNSCGGGCLATRLRAVAAADSDEEYCRYRMRLIDGVAALIATPATPSAIFCRRVHARSRQINAMADVARFLSRWRDPQAPHQPVRLEASTYGNINTAGAPGTHGADDLDPLHPLWRNAIEPGVWPLVDALTTGWGLVTYDSCQGHPYTGLALTPAERRVGILPRTADEYATVATALCRAVASIESRAPESIQVVIGRADLSCTTTDARFPVLDVRFERNEGYDWSTYFADLESATTVMVDAVASTSLDALVECGCSTGLHADSGAV